MPAPHQSSDRSKRLCVLLVDDETPTRDATAMALRHLGYEVQPAVDAESALRAFDPELHALVVTDNRMPGLSGAELATKLRERSPRTPIVMYTGFAPPLRPPVDCLLEKPVELATLESVLRQLLPG